MIETDYHLAWAAYGVAALGCLLVWFRMTRWMWRWLREPLRVLVAVLLLTPTLVDPGKELFAPAIAITTMDLVLKVGNNAWRAVSDLVLFGLLAFGAYLVFAAVRWPLERWWKARREEDRPPAEDEPTLREVLEDERRYGYQGERRMRVEPRL